MNAALTPVILSGGSGTRLWPLSRAQLPKQFLPLVSEATMLQETWKRLDGIGGLTAPMVVCNEDHRFLAAEQLREAGAGQAGVLLEPVGRNTAPAIAAAAFELVKNNPDAVMLVLPADHLILDLPAFHKVVEGAVRLAVQGKLVTFGIPPDHPATGFGYIERGNALGEGGYEVRRFVEKPRREVAEGFLAEGGFYWNSGMFVFRAQTYLDELKAHRPDIHAASLASWQAAKRDPDFCRLAKEQFVACPSDSIDYAVMEKTAHAAVIEAGIGWNDIGSWEALWSTAARDGDGNVTRGDVELEAVTGSYIRAEERLVAAVGVSDLVIVETADAVLVAHKDRAQDVKLTVDSLKRKARGEHMNHRRVYRPWGYYESLDNGSRFQVKRLMVKPGGKLSLQLHRHRSEHWVVVSGTARVTRGEDVFDLLPDQSTYLPIGTKHRLENVTDEPVYMIEVQSGDYLGEDDIERFDDIYRRD
jgi:mannose-1-phosphate guanylyltransferase/mannose-6-phosphate isomerase